MPAASAPDPRDVIKVVGRVTPGAGERERMPPEKMAA